MGIKTLAFLLLSFLIACSSGIKVTISLETQATNPPPLELDVAYATPVISMMEEAAGVDSHYNFGGTYYGSMGWLIQMYDNIENDLVAHNCWYFYVQLPGEPQIKPNVGVSAYQLVIDETMVTFKYEFDVYCQEYSEDSKGKTEL